MNGSPCWSVAAIPGMTVGLAAELVIENQSPQLNPPTTQFTDFIPQVAMEGGAYSSATGYWQTISSDPVVNLLTDYTNTTSHMSVSLATHPPNVFQRLAVAAGGRRRTQLVGPLSFWQPGLLPAGNFRGSEREQFQRRRRLGARNWPSASAADLHA